MLVEFIYKENIGFVILGILECIDVVNFLDEEYFGLLFKVFCFIDFDVVIDKVNDISFGLLVGLLSDSVVDYDYFLCCICVGIVNWNCLIIGVLSVVLFGGIGVLGNYWVSVYYVVDYCVYLVVLVEFEKVVMLVILSLGLKID